MRELSFKDSGLSRAAPTAGASESSSLIPRLGIAGVGGAFFDTVSDITPQHIRHACTAPTDRPGNLS